VTATLHVPTAVPAAGPTAQAPSGLLDRRPSRAGAVALVAGAALNTAQAVLMRTVGGGDTPAAKLADADAHPGLLLAMILGGMLGVVLLLVGLQHVAQVVRPHAPRTARVGSVLVFAGTLGFLGMHVLMLVTYALVGMDDRSAAVAVLEHLETAPVLLVLVVPFLLGMFGGVATLTVGLLRSAGVPRWVPACWALFLPLDLLAAGAGPVDPHWLFLAGAVGIALATRPATGSATGSATGKR
jgi:hypothetical protein